MPLKDITTSIAHFSEEEINSTAAYSHKLKRGVLKDSPKQWIIKEIASPTDARIEILAQEFFRLIIPHQPETRLLENPHTRTHFILSEEAPGYRDLPNEPLNFANGTYTGLGQVLICSVFLEEVDLKNGNLGLDAQGRVIKIDGDWCFAEWQRGGVGRKYGLTPEMIANLPYPRDFYAFNWLDLAHQEVKSVSSRIVNPDLINARQFRDEVNQAMLKICILPDRFIEHFIDAYIPAGGSRFVELIKNRRTELQASALQNLSFQTYLKTPQAQEDAQSLINQMNSFVANGDKKVMHEQEHQTAHEEVMRHMTALTASEQKLQIRLDLPSENTDLLNQIYSQRVNNNDRIVIDYVTRMRQQLSSGLHENELLDMKKELKQVLQSVSSPQCQAVKNAAHLFRDNIRWWTVGNEKKAQRIEHALARTPIEMRANVITAPSPSNKVQDALASHRHWGYEGHVYKDDKYEINLNKAADTFKMLKKQFTEDKAARETDKNSDTDSSHIKFK
ncbi:hypothetical protein [Legionella bononiensis]|uniref:hypothetical protein n=1 Tax=Legionella bononiensis TaxID=2793102 RepID=UPI001933BD31|nr:hypothetical protein [Legionella bononiensis]MBL7480598.1 hypothetical protein [Legionella bononiensis]